jgi:O-antigen/teichoic acid export membrane protein
MATARSIIKNTSYLSLAYIAQKVLSFVYFALIANIAGVSNTGAYVFALSYTTIFSVFADFGLANLLQRTIANKSNKKELSQIVSSAFTIKIVFACLASFIALTIIHLTTSDVLTLQMIYIALIIMLVDSFNLMIWSVFRGLHKLGFEAISVVIGQTVIMLVGVSGLFFLDSTIILIAALLAGSMSSAIFGLYWFKRTFNFFPKPHPIKKLNTTMLKEAIPFGLANTFTRIFSSFDSVLLRFLVSEAAVGFYSVPNKVVFAMQFIPSAFAASVYPAMSHYYQKDHQKIIDIFTYSMIFLFLVSVPIALGIFSLIPVIIGTVFDASYHPAIPAMQILVWAVVFGFCEFPIGSVLNAMHYQKKNMITRAIVMIVNIVLNIVLIPYYSFVGSSIAALISYILLVVIGLFWVNNVISIPWTKLIWAGCKILLSGIIMAIIVQLLLNMIHYIFVVIIGAIVYTICIFVFKVITIQNLKQLRNMVKSR